MTDVDTSKLSWDEWDELHNPPPAETEFDRVVESALSRRGFLGGVLAIGSAAAAMGTLGNEYVPGTLPERVTTEVDYVRIWR